MNLITTKSFQLAVYKKGDENSSRLALVLPGLLDTKDYAHLRSHVNYLAARGYLALSFDPPGTWESPGDIGLYTVTNYIKAINELIEYFGNRPTFLTGHSRGATMSVAIGSTNKHVFAFAPIMPSHIDGAYEGTVNETWKKTSVFNNLRELPPGGGPKVKHFALPYSFFEDQIRYNFTDDLARCEKPKLFIYGTSDNGATPERVKAIYDVAARPKELYELESDHNYRYHTHLIDEVNKVIGEFLEKL